MKCLRRAFPVILLLMTISPVARADWIKGQFSEKAGIDSIERFLVVRDIDSCRIIGHPIVPLGDINRDGCSDILLVHKGGCLDTSSTYLYYGGRPPDGILDQVYHGFNSIMANIGDINNDDFDDLANFRCDSIRLVEIFLGSETFDDSPDYFIPNVLSWLRKPADLDDDGYIEFPLSKDMGTQWIVNLYQVGPAGVDTIPEYVIADTSRNFGDNLATGDFNGDGYPDLVIAAYLNRDSSFVKFYWGGPDFDTIPDFEIWRIATLFGETLLPLGDFNGDGYEDILIDGGVANGWSIPGGVFFGGPDIDNNLDIVTDRFTYGGYLSARSASVAGDVNLDGYPDLLIGVVVENASIYEAKIFLGGPDADSIPDVYLSNALINYHQTDLGAAVAGIGDFNGDGIDDFALRSRTTTGCCWWGEVNFFAGWDSKVTDVGYEYEPTYPKAFELKQNYPNPFNLSTTIELSLPHHSHTKISIYNLLGAKVATLIDRDLPAGLHRVTWKGTDSAGQTVASGIYFYHVATDFGNLGRKMILMK